MSKNPLIARLLAPADREAWDDLAARHGCLFDSLRWTDLFGPRLIRIGLYDAGGELRGGFCLWEERRFGLRILRNPPYTPQIGPFFQPRASNPVARTDEQRSVVEAMAAYLDSSGAAIVSLGLALPITDCLPFYWRRYKVVPHWLYRIDLRSSSDSLLAGMSTEKRKTLRKAQQECIISERASDSKVLLSLVARTYSRQRPPLPLDFVEAILKSYLGKDECIAYIARHNQRALAGVFFLSDSTTAYGVLSGYDHEGGHSSAETLAMWQAILMAKERGLQVFDFSGSVIPRFEHYLRGFGGQLTPIMSVHKAWLPLEMALKLIPHYRNRF